MRVVAIDFETANYKPASICAAGLAVFVDGEMTESIYWLVRPPKGHGWFFEDFTEVHGLTWFDVQHEPEFIAIAPQFLDYLTSADLVVAHNAAFDLRMLRGTLAHYGVDLPTFNCECTLRLSRHAWPDLPSHTLDAVAAHIGHHFEHHHAQADAEAAGRIAIAALALTAGVHN